MITKFSVTNSKDEILSLDITKPSNGLTVIDIDGISSLEATINSTDIVTYDGAIYNSARVSTRDITFTFLLQEYLKTTYTTATSYSTTYMNVEKVRNSLYKYFQIKKKVSLTFTNDSGTVYKIDGYVKSINISVFSSQEQAQIVVTCLQPYFKASVEKNDTLSEMADAFEFPFKENEEFEFGTITPLESKSLYYSGNVTYGYTLNISIINNISNSSSITISSNDTKITIDLAMVKTITGGSTNLVAGDKISINTVRGSKNITLTRSSTSYNIINSLAKNSTFPEMEPGYNKISVSTSSTGDQDSIFTTITYSDTYEGI